MFFLQWAPTTNCPQEEAAKAAAEAKASKAEESGDRWVAKPEWKTAGNAGKTFVEVTTFPHKLWENLEKPTPQLWDIMDVFSVFFFPLL